MQFTHRLPGRGGKKPIETKVRVDDDSLFGSYFSKVFSILTLYSLKSPLYIVFLKSLLYFHFI